MSHSVNRIFSKLSFIYITLLLATFFSVPSIAAPALFQIEKNGVSSYLLGTVHVGDQSMKGLPTNITQAIEKSQRVVVEVNVDAISPIEMQRRSMPFMMLPNGRTLQSVLSAQNYAALDAYFKNKKINIALFNNLSPWAVMITMLQLEFQKLGFHENNGIDKQVLAYARTHQKEIVELETLEQQLEMLSQIGIKSDLMISETLKQIKDVDSYFLNLVSAWKKGDMATLSKYYKLSFEDPDYGKFSEELMVIQRNHNWVEQLTPLLTRESLFIAVGALHLPEQDGLLTLLKKQGFKVSRL